MKMNDHAPNNKRSTYRATNVARDVARSIVRLLNLVIFALTVLLTDWSKYAHTIFEAEQVAGYFSLLTYYNIQTTSNLNLQTSYEIKHKAPKEC